MVVILDVRYEHWRGEGVFGAKVLPLSKKETSNRKSVLGKRMYEKKGGKKDEWEKGREKGCITFVLQINIHVLHKKHKSNKYNAFTAVIYHNERQKGFRVIN